MKNECFSTPSNPICRLILNHNPASANNEQENDNIQAGGPSPKLSNLIIILIQSFLCLILAYKSYMSVCLTVRPSVPVLCLTSNKQKTRTNICFKVGNAQTIGLK